MYSLSESIIILQCLPRVSEKELCKKTDEHVSWTWELHVWPRTWLTNMVEVILEAADIQHVQYLSPISRRLLKHMWYTLVPVCISKVIISACVIINVCVQSKLQPWCHVHKLHAMHAFSYVKLACILYLAFLSISTNLPNLTFSQYFRLYDSLAHIVQLSNHEISLVTHYDVR